MKRLVAVSFVVAALMLAAFPQAATRTLPPAGVTALDTFLGGQVSRGAIPGVVAVVVNRQGTLYSGAFGKQNTAKNVPLTADSIFRIASMTKAVTSVATMMMVEQGKLKLDDDVSTYLPAFKSMQVLTSLRREGGHLRDAAEHEADHDPPAAHAHVRHRLQLVRPGPRARAAQDQRGQRDGAAARARARREVDLRRQHQGARRRGREALGRAHRRVHRPAHRQAARHGRHVLRGAEGAATRAS